MKYIISKSQRTHKEMVYAIKKVSVFPYVNNIWGWDEEYQRKDFDIDFLNIE